MTTTELEEGIYWIWKQTSSLMERLKYIFLDELTPAIMRGRSTLTTCIVQ